MNTDSADTYSYLLTLSQVSELRGTTGREKNVWEVLEICPHWLNDPVVKL